MRDELPNAPEEWRDRAISGSAKPRLDHLLPRGRGPVRLPLSKWEDQDESHLTGRELLLLAAEAEDRWFGAGADGDGIASHSPLRDRELAAATLSPGCSPSRHRTAGLLP